MPEDDKTEDPTPPTPEQIEEWRKASVEYAEHKAALENFEVGKDGEKTVTVNLLTEDGRKRAAQLGSGGFHVSQEMERLNQEKAALDAKVKEQVEFALKKRGESHDAAGEPVDVDKLIADNAELTKAVEDGDPEAFKKGMAKVLKEVLKAKPAKSEQPTGVSKEELDAKGREVQDATERAVIFKTRVRPDPRFKALATHLAKVYHCTPVEAETRIVADMARIDPATTGDMTPDTVILEKVVAPWLEELGIKVGAPSSEGRGSGKEESPDGSHPAGGGPGGPGPRTFQSEIEVDKYRDEQRKKNKPGAGKWHPTG